MFFENQLYLDDIHSTAKDFIDLESLQGSRILVTGATGLIGTFLVDIFMHINKTAKEPMQIYVLGRNRSKLITHFKSHLHTEYFFLVEHDVCKPLEQELHIDYIFHGASNTHPLSYAAEPINTILLSVMGTKNILDFAVRVRTKRVVFLSTVEIYGENRGDIDFFDEKYCGYIDCNTVRAGYPEGKRAAESLCQAYIAEYRLDIIVARLCRIYGPTMGPDDSKAIAQFIRNAVNNAGIVLKSDGSQEYSYLYVADVCSALLFLLQKGQSAHAYNIADSAERMSLRNIAQILSAYNQKDIVFDLPSIQEKVGFSVVTKALLDNLKIRKAGWQPKYSLQDGLYRTISILRSERKYV